MSYCRWSDGDVYMYASVNGGIECCSCKFAPKVKSVFTEGTKNHPIFKDMSPCKQCGGKGCDACMLHTNMTLKTYEDALEHLQKHKDSGDDVPEYAFEGLREDMKRGEPLEPLYCACGKIAMVFSFDGKPPRCIECASKDEKENK